MTRVLGIDLGLANPGFAAVEQTDTGVVLRGLRYVETQKDAKAASVFADDARRIHEIYDQVCELMARVKPDVVAMEGYAVYDTKAQDDMRDASRRLLATLGFTGADRRGALRSGEELGKAAASARFMADMTDSATGLWNAIQAIGNTAGRGNAAKVLEVQGACLAVCWQTQTPHLLQTPGQIRTFLGCKPRASKLDVHAAVLARLPNLDELAAARGIPAGKREHVTDAAAHALLGLNTWHRRHRQ